MNSTEQQFYSCQDLVKRLYDLESLAALLRGLLRNTKGIIGG